MQEASQTKAIVPYNPNTQRYSGKLPSGMEILRLINKEYQAELAEKKESIPTLYELMQSAGKKLKDLILKQPQYRTQTQSSGGKTGIFNKTPSYQDVSTTKNTQPNSSTILDLTKDMIVTQESPEKKNNNLETTLTEDGQNSTSLETNISQTPQTPEYDVQTNSDTANYQQPEEEKNGFLGRILQNGNEKKRLYQKLITAYDSLSKSQRETLSSASLNDEDMFKVLSQIPKTDIHSFWGKKISTKAVQKTMKEIKDIKYERDSILKRHEIDSLLKGL